LGQSVGLQGQTYAIPTPSAADNHFFSVVPQGHTIPLLTIRFVEETIMPYVDEFIQFAKDNPDKIFLVTEIGCGIAGFNPNFIAPLFIDAFDVENIYLPRKFWNELIEFKEIEYDPIELTEQYLAIEDELNEKIKAEIIERYGWEKWHNPYMGFCHTYWEMQKEILKQDYDIVWYSPADLNPESCYD
jgi:hypothetical protein